MDDNTLNSSNSSFSSPTESVGDRAARLVDQAKTAGRAAVDSIDDKREAAAETLSSTAAKLHAKASEYSEGHIQGAAHKTADSLEATADFMRNHPLSRVKDDVESFAKRNPGAALLMAAGIGFLLGRSLTRD
jgi:ElaB/YqjD/DUF883 family membrane-anchored ribosome-binding protein